jgi:2-polyprenyl-3-methyl-5-hydroxy-6-metoxy-1,4-benzoquinol methylase
MLGEKTFDVISAFAVLHHIPGETLREAIISKLAARLAAGGVFIHSEWQFMNSQRLRERIQPWEVINLVEAQVDSGDYLLDWRSGGNGLRYVHQFTSSELERLAEKTGFSIQSEFSSDGENGQLGLYQVWTRQKGSQDCPG